MVSPKVRTKPRRRINSPSQAASSTELYPSYRLDFDDSRDVSGRFVLPILNARSFQQAAVWLSTGLLCLTALPPESVLAVEFQWLVCRPIHNPLPRSNSSSPPPQSSSPA